MPLANNALPCAHANNQQQKLVVAASISPNDLMWPCLRKTKKFKARRIVSGGLFLCAAPRRTDVKRNNLVFFSRITRENEN
ncbi:MAG: hypothetical protein AAFN92_11725 [Bacteroidota bacterium]